MPDSPDLAALIGSRICHDLISPIGAIGNGLELLMMDGRGAGPEMTLISESVNNATARIRFFRIAFGQAKGDHRLARGEVQSILSDLMRGGRLQIDWQSGADLRRADVKLVFLLILCLEAAMAYGGRVAVSVSDGRWIVTGHADKLKIDPALWELLVNPAMTADVAPAQVQFPLVAAEIARQQRRLSAQLGEAEIRLSF